MPRPQTLKGAKPHQPQQAHAIVGQRFLQLQHLARALAIGSEQADDLAVHLEAIQQVRDVGGFLGGGHLPIDVHPDQSRWVDGAAEDLCQVDHPDVGVAFSDGGEGASVSGVQEGGAGVVGVILIAELLER